jgi:hypothetical protein
MNLKPIIIETQRLKLTGYSSQDMTFIFENLNKDEIKKILGHRTDEDFQKEEYSSIIDYGFNKLNLHRIEALVGSEPQHNIGLAIWRLKCFYETFVQGSTAVILLNFCAKNPPHRQAEKRLLGHREKTLSAIRPLCSYNSRRHNEQIS